MNEGASTRSVATWQLWRLPYPVVLVVLAVDAGAVLALVVDAALPTRGQLALACFLILLSLVHTELANGIERMRRRAASSSYFDLSSVWTFTAALLLPPLLAGAVVLATYLHLWRRVWRPAKVPPHRHLFTTATVVLAAVAAHTALTALGGLPSGPSDVLGVVAVVVAVLAYVAVNTLLVALVIALTTGVGSPRELLGRWDDNALELATICMGALAAVAIDVSPALVALALPPVLVLHRAVLVRQLEEVASTDGKTGLLNAASWRDAAERAVRRARRTGGGAGVLICDLDHFKRVNDEHGHLAGDDVLAAVADELRSAVRGADVVGRFGGEEFVVLVPDLPVGQRGRAELVEVGERIRQRIERLAVPATTVDGVTSLVRLSVSIGGAGVPLDGPDLDSALARADAALYAAKHGGRNQVRLSAPVRPRGELPAAVACTSATVPAPRVPQRPHPVDDRSAVPRPAP